MRVLPSSAFLLAFLAACGGGGDGAGTTPPPPAPATVATVDVSPASATLAIGATSQLSATPRDASGNALSGRTVTWASGNTAVATVNGSGLVTAVAAGSTTVTATADGRTGQATITVTPPPVAAVVLNRDTASVLAGGTVQLNATPRDAAGATLAGRTITWSSSATAVATVDATGLVSAVTPGTATITATVEGRTASATVTAIDPARIPTFVRPFAATVNYYTTNFHDHDVPRSFQDNGRKVTFWGEQYNATGYEGHEGYDWRMDTGTPLLAIADGTVISTSHAAFFCPLINATVPADGNGLMVLEHLLPGGVRVRSLYAHMSRKDVQVGARVTAGQQIGLSGGVGCSLNPHLHLGIFRMTQTKNGQASIIDPYGWEGPGTDPWLNEADGAASIYLWKPNEAPALFTRTVVDFNANGGSTFFGLSLVQAMGVKDDQNPNNEYIEVSRDPRFAPASVALAGATIRTKAGTLFTFPANATLTAADPTIRVYSGSGTSTATTIYLGRTTPAYNNLNECVEVLNASGQLRGRAGWGTGCT
ncbi:MAG: Ig-like domain-containing protein [Gemmatimonadetes bacterium]|nr:Ig-like domain-containing protein [Gemmatimonadota bacterium]